MNGMVAFLRSSIGLKVIMALTGLILFGFVIEHVIGMLFYFRGRSIFNGYSQFLHESPILLWGVRMVLLASVGLHIFAATILYLRERAARPEAYQMRRMRIPSYAARTMKYSGPFIAAFVVFHILHLTVGVRVTPARYIPGDVYANVTASFSHGWVALVYVTAVSLLGLHLSHGAHSLFESLGLRHPTFDQPLRIVLWALTGFIVVGFCILPVLIFFNFVGG
jgi:succinate dehydrogenase / fumarate reductase cytochrome b subunit